MAANSVNESYIFMPRQIAEELAEIKEYNGIEVDFSSLEQAFDTPASELERRLMDTVMSSCNGAIYASGKGYRLFKLDGPHLSHYDGNISYKQATCSQSRPSPVGFDAQSIHATAVWEGQTKKGITLVVPSGIRDDGKMYLATEVRVYKLK